MLVSIIFVGVNALEAFDRQKSPAVLRKKTRVKKIAAKDVKKTTAGEHGKNSDAETESQK
jgi:hypothetical protein